MRKAIDGLNACVADHFPESAQSGSLFVFYNKAKDKVKILYWNKNGFILHYKRLERGRFKCQKSDENETMEITEEQLEWLLAGLDFTLMHQFSELNYSHYY